MTLIQGDPRNAHPSLDSLVVFTYVYETLTVDDWVLATTCIALTAWLFA